MPAQSHRFQLPGIVGYINHDVKVEIEEQIKKEKAVSDALVDFGLYDKSEELNDQCTTYTSFVNPLIFACFATLVIILVLNGTLFSEEKSNI